MIYFNNIDLNSNKTLEEQIEELSNGDYYLKNAQKIENRRIKNKEKLYNGKINLHDYAKESRLIIDEVLLNIEKEEYFGSTDNLPF